MTKYIVKTIYYNNTNGDNFFAITKHSPKYTDNKLNKYELIPLYDAFYYMMYKSINKEKGFEEYIIPNLDFRICIYYDYYTISYKDDDNDIFIIINQDINNKWDEKYNTYMTNIKCIPFLNTRLNISKSFNDIVNEKVHGELIDLMKKYMK